MKPEDFWEELELEGPWSWSDLQGHIATIICYHLTFRKTKKGDYEETLDEILATIRKLVLFRLI